MELTGTRVDEQTEQDSFITLLLRDMNAEWLRHTTGLYIYTGPPPKKTALFSKLKNIPNLLVMIWKVK